MRKILVFVFALSLYPGLQADAQYYYENNRYFGSDFTVEVGGSFGIMNALTDLGGRKGVGKKFIKDLNWKNSKPAAGFYLAGTFRDAIAVRVEATFGTVQAYDSILKSVKTTTFGRYERNLSFKSKITDLQLAAEIHPLFFKSYDEDPPRISPYGVIGVGYYSFDPRTKFNGQWYSLQPLHTEGQGAEGLTGTQPYKLSQLNVAAGFGVRYEVNSLFRARLEFVHRFLNTDYLDDVSTIYVDPGVFNSTLTPSQAALAQQLFDRQGELTPGHVTDVGAQRGNPNNKDAFFTIQLKVGIVLGRQKR